MVPGPNGPPTDASVGKLVKQLSQQTSRLAHQDVEHTKAELVVEGWRIETEKTDLRAQASTSSMRRSPT